MKTQGKRSLGKERIRNEPDISKSGTKAQPRQENEESNFPPEKGRKAWMEWVKPGGEYKNRFPKPRLGMGRKTGDLSNFESNKQ